MGEASGTTDILIILFLTWLCFMGVVGLITFMRWLTGDGQ